MSIEDEIKAANGRQPTPVWEGLARLDHIAQSAREGTWFADGTTYREIAKPTPKAEVRPVIAVGTPWSSIPFTKLEGTETHRASTQPKPEGMSAMKIQALRASARLKERMK
jgi:hypothetical protein